MNGFRKMIFLAIPKPELLSLTVEPMGSMKLFTMGCLWWEFPCLVISMIMWLVSKAKGAAVEVDLPTMTSSDLLHALKEVINNPREYTIILF
ncbi:hypothetical protein Cadr_000001814 [Camelus dromedarius]|uniref:Uncharacterized protein n=1 Tax=Camelus dromedarius TaxID=9838 RepID=A0A5N4EHA4_CAMDR|nr:hypothetical protein Cadr_000001814 [Camelus dromedarius]